MNLERAHIDGIVDQSREPFAPLIESQIDNRTTGMFDSDRVVVATLHGQQKAVDGRHQHLLLIDLNDEIYGVQIGQYARGVGVNNRIGRTQRRWI